MNRAPRVRRVPGTASRPPLLDEALGPIRAQPWKTLLTGLGVAVAAAAQVLLMGIQGMNESALIEHVRQMTSNEVQTDLSRGFAPGDTPWRQADATLAGAGLAQSFTSWRLQVEVAAVDTLGTRTPAAWSTVALSPAVETREDIALAGGSWDDLFTTTRAVFIGAGLMRQDGLQLGDTISVAGEPMVVRGVIASSASRPDLLLSVVLPDTVALRLGGVPEAVRTTGFAPPGAANTLASAVPTLLSPEAPHTVQARAVPDAAPLLDAVTADVATGARYVGAIAILLGFLMVALAQYSAVVEHLPAYALKKSVGASGAQLLTEVGIQAGVIGAVGGLVGLAAGLVGLTAVAAWRDLVAYVPWGLVIGLPPLAALVGALAGMGAAARAARVDPITFIRRS